MEQPNSIKRSKRFIRKWDCRNSGQYFKIRRKKRLAWIQQRPETLKPFKIDAGEYRKGFSVNINYRPLNINHLIDIDVIDQIEKNTACQFCQMCLKPRIAVTGWSAACRLWNSQQNCKPVSPNLLFFWVSRHRSAKNLQQMHGIQAVLITFANGWWFAIRTI